jgi:hypothetical protein
MNLNSLLNLIAKLQLIAVALFIAFVLLAWITRPFNNFLDILTR